MKKLDFLEQKRFLQARQYLQNQIVFRTFDPEKSLSVFGNVQIEKG